MKSFLSTVKNIIENQDTKGGKRFDLFILILILISIFSFSYETVPNMSDMSKLDLKILEISIISIFAIEYILRVITADDKMKFIFSLPGLIDLAVVLPFFLFGGIDLRVLRIFRLFRVAKIFKLVKFTQAIDHFKLAFNTIIEELKVFFVAMIFVLYISAVGIYYFEHKAQPEVFSSIFHSLWWSVVTLTTVGYGDMSPITVGGRLFTFGVLLCGLGIVAVPTGLISTALAATVTKAKNKELK